MKSAAELTPVNVAFARLGVGLGLRPVHYSHVLSERPAVDWFEVISENFIGLSSDPSGGRPFHTLEKVRRDYPIVLHGVSMSIGSVDSLNKDYLKRLKDLAARVQPAWVSDHLCWTGVNGRNMHDLMPLPYTEEALEHVVSRVKEVQDFLGRRLVLENVSSYVSFAHSEMTEWEFLAEIARRADCGLLLDINNVYVSSFNHGFEAMDYLRGIPRDRVVQFHLAGHSNNGTHLIDTHDHPVPDSVWALYAEALKLFGSVSTLIEWDDRIPEFPVLNAEAEKARALQSPQPWREHEAFAG